MPNPQPLPSLRGQNRTLAWLPPLALGAVALVVFGWDLPAEPHFVDESAYISQSYYADLFLSGDVDNPQWLGYPGVDLPPLPKYLIGWSLRVAGYPRPGPDAARAWYANTSRRFLPAPALTVARIPAVILGALGCVAIYAIGATAGGARVGLVAALMLMFNPLYRMHARRAMSDVPAEALILAALAVGLWAWTRILGRRGILVPALALALGGGILAGLATLAKLNGALGGIVLAAWAGLALAVPTAGAGRKLVLVLATLVAGAVAIGTFTALNPFVTAHPKPPVDPRLAEVAEAGWLERMKMIYDHRVGLSATAATAFPHNALVTAADRVSAVVVQGFGRFGPLGPRGWTDSTIRFDRRQDWGAVVWLPLVAIGLVVAVLRGRGQIRRGEPPAASAVALQAVVACGVVTAFIPLAWDRYYLSLQPGFALLGSFALNGLWDLARALDPRKPPTRPEL